MKDARGRDLQDGDICLVPVKVSRIHSGHASAVSLLNRRTDGGKDTFYIDTGTAFLVNDATLKAVEDAEFTRPAPSEAELPLEQPAEEPTVEQALEEAPAAQALQEPIVQEAG